MSIVVKTIFHNLENITNHLTSVEMIILQIMLNITGKVINRTV